MKFDFPFTSRQREMVEHPARVLWCGTGTKTGKSLASYCWLIEGLLNGEACAFTGPWFFRSRRAFDECKNLLEPFIRSKAVRINEARLQIVSRTGGYCDFLSADNPDCLFGANYHRLVLDESSRMPAAIYGAALTTVSGTGGKLRCFFNLELGTKNWSIRNLLRVQRLSEAERAASGEAVLMFPSGGDGLVSEELIQQLKTAMPLPLWEALYLAKIPDSDCSLFRNLDKIFVGQELEEPLPGLQYFLAADVARKKDWSVLTVIDEHGRVACMDRFHQISWSLQVERAKLLYETFGCRKAIIDSTGLGDVIAEKFEEAGMVVESFIFTVPSRRQLIEELVMGCDNREIIVPATEKFRVYREELESMEYQLDGTSIKYAVPSGSHDDALFSLALATHVYRSSRGAILGVLDLARRMVRDISEGVRDFYGELIHKPEPKPVPVLVRKEAAVIATEAPKKKANDPCPNPDCRSTSTWLMGDGVGGVVLYCNQCGGKDGVVPIAPLAVGDICPAEGCGLKLVMSGTLRCQNHGQVAQPKGEPTNGLSFERYRKRNKFAWR